MAGVEGDTSPVYHPTAAAERKAEDATHTLGTVRCSQSILSRFVTRFDEPQKDAIEKVGFGSLLKLKPMSIRRTTVKQIVDCYDARTGLFDIAGIKIEMTFKDVVHILDLPSTGPEITGPPNINVPELFEGYKWQGKKHIDSAHLKEYLSKTTDSDDNFVRIFVLYCIGFYLCPTKQDYVESKYTSLLVNVKAIKAINWSSLFFHDLHEKLRTYKLRQGKNVAGNLAFLQVWYWEKFSITHIDRTLSNIGHKKPAIQYWDQERAEKRINAASFGKGRIIEDITSTIEFTTSSPEVASDTEQEGVPQEECNIKSDEDVNKNELPSDDFTSDVCGQTSTQQCGDSISQEYTKELINEATQQIMLVLKKYIRQEMTPLLDAIDSVNKNYESTNKMLATLIKNSQIPGQNHTYIPEDLRKSHTLRNHEKGDNSGHSDKKKEDKTKNQDTKYTFFPEHLRKSKTTRQEENSDTQNHSKEKEETEPKSMSKGTQKQRASRRKAKPIQNKDEQFDYTCGTKKRKRGPAPRDCYTCTEDDIPTLDHIESSELKRRLVKIQDVVLTKETMQCLADKNGWLGDEVIDASIRCLEDKMRPDKREGGRALLQTTPLLNHIMNKEEDIQPPWVKETIAQHLNNEMYITNQLQRLEDYYEKIRKPRGCKWRDHYVSDWEVVEQIEKSMQRDGSSCGLFLLKFMEYWTGTRLSQIFTQEDMNNFRSKLAVLLVNSKLNDLRPGAATNTIPEDQPEDDGAGDDSDEYPDWENYAIDILMGGVKLTS
ncbi:hypothetical protein EJB05_19911 [Eragrostis curvula]|uniref:Uncharacterized protein n=1 Tax=Eragrostis curvula TaxID=38414 RepID=A0A5J9UYM6_9POAL|nr:hypothetical protein EJB05_19911 [Eragrostis curvula]